MKLYNKSPSQLQHSLNRIVEWSEKWQLQLAPDKCQILSLIVCRRSFNPYEYWINSHKLTRADIVRDLRVLIDSSLHFDKHIDNVIKKASNVSKLLLLSFSTRHQNILMKAFCTYVRPILEYNSPVWSPHRKSLTDRIEKIQKRFTKAIPTLSPHPYMQRLKLLKLPSLEKRRLLADLSLCFKIKNHLIYTTIPLISSNCYRTRGHNHKLATCKFRCETSKHFICNRIIKPWNSLPADIVNSSTLTRFNSAIRQLNFNKYLRFKEL